MMDDKQLSNLLRVKRAREQRAAARSAQALAAQQAAQAQQAEAEQAQARHAAERPHREASAYARLLDGIVPAHRVQADTALLSGLVAVSALLTAKCEEAAQDTGKRQAVTQQARRDQACAIGGTEAALAIRRALAGHALASAERASELEQEDLGPALATRLR